MLAFTFQEQPFNDTHRMNEMLDFSAEQLEDAYSRMEMRSQPWAKHTIPEVNFIEEHLDLKKE